MRSEIEENPSSTSRVKELAPRGSWGELANLYVVECADLTDELIRGHNKRGEGEVLGVQHLSAGLDQCIGLAKCGGQRLLNHHNRT
jgi:hypothetical protein